MNIYVGNLAAATTEEDLKEVFGAHGQINNVKIIKDFDTGHSRGFAFIDMSQDEGQAAIEALHGSDLNGNSLTVNEAYERARKTGGGGGSRGGFRGNRDRNGGNRNRF